MSEIRAPIFHRTAKLLRIADWSVTDEEVSPGRHTLTFTGTRAGKPIHEQVTYSSEGDPGVFHQLANKVKDRCRSEL